jgi:Na+/proline symporter
LRLDGSAWRGRLAAPGIAALAIACCLAAPLLIGAVGAVSAGALFGLVAAAAVSLALCLAIALRLRSRRGW